MPDLIKLSKEQRIALKRFERARDAELRFELLRMSASSRIRVARAVSTGLDASRRAQARHLASLARRMAAGYDRLEHIPGAIRFSGRLADFAARQAGLVPEVKK